MKEFKLDSENDVLHQVSHILHSDKHIVVAYDIDNGNLIVSKSIPTEDAVLLVNQALWHTDDPDIHEVELVEI